MSYYYSEKSDEVEDRRLLIDGYDHNHLLYRVYDGTSASPYDSDGFTATSSEYRPALSGSQWRRTHSHLYFNKDFRTSDATRETIIRHVLGGWPGHTYRGFTGPSDWISTTESFEWSIWEIARRLSLLKRPYVSLALISREIWYQNSYRGNRNIVENSEDAIMAYSADYGLDSARKDALAFARASSEMLFLGRIFPKDIKETVVFTSHKLPPGFGRKQPFMQAFFKPRHKWTSNSWLDGLVFELGRGSKEAKAKIQERREELAQSRRVYR